MEKQNEIALIMAAGMGTRMLPLTKTVAKPLIPVNGTPMIETLLNALITRGVHNIYVVVGYKKEQFEYLKQKYNNIVLIENNEYSTKNNISSIRAAERVLGSENCFICEADLYISDNRVFEHNFTESCYFAKFIEGPSEDWVFNVVDNRITSIQKGGQGPYNMTGVSFWLKEDIRIIRDAILEAYSKPDHNEYFWDEIVNKELKKIDVGVHVVRQEYITEIDTVDELHLINSKQ